MRVDLFDFHLPPERIALRPEEPRDQARLLVVRPDGTREDRIVADLGAVLRPGDALVFNDTRVIPAQLDGVRARGGSNARLSATLHKRTGPADWLAFVRGARKLAIGDTVRFSADPSPFGLNATVLGKQDDEGVRLSFDLAGTDLDAAIARIGHVPLPPYIASKRAEDSRDRDDYQTVYAREDGSVAAPTAGLHFTPQLLDDLRARGIGLHFLTLHVGAGTFLPVKAEDTADHRMLSEFGLITPESAAALNTTRAAGGRIVAVGTTSLRLLETAVDEKGTIQPFAGETDIFITPGFVFRAVDALMTNFHLPKSTLFMLVSAFMGLETMRAAYAHAIGHDYRFYSYGDASLLIRRDTP